MNKKQIYDIPTRLFHWLFAGLFISAFLIAKNIDDESPIYAYHMLIGMTMTVTVLLRIVWGIIGSRWAKFSSFPLQPYALLKYTKDIFISKTKRYIGHNPASSWAALIMMALTFGLAGTGYMMTQDINRHFFKEIHELCANAFIIVVVAHIAGILFHTLRHKENIGLSMITGKKAVPVEEKGIQNTHLLSGIMFVCLVGFFAIHLYKNYDNSTQTLTMFGRNLHLGDTKQAD